MPLVSARAGEGVGAVGGVGADADAGGFGGEKVRPGRDCGPGRASVCAEMCRARAISLLDMFFALGSMMGFALLCFAMVNLPFSILLAMPVEYRKRGSA